MCQVGHNIPGGEGRVSLRWLSHTLAIKLRTEKASTKLGQSRSALLQQRRRFFPLPEVGAVVDDLNGTVSHVRIEPTKVALDGSQRQPYDGRRILVCESECEGRFNLGPCFAVSQAIL